MRNFLIIIALLLLSQAGLSQTPSLVGTWSFTGDSSVISYSFQKEGGCFIHKGLKDGVILPENLKKGTYAIKNNLLSIQWVDHSLEERILTFIDTNTLILSDTRKPADKKKEMILQRKIFNTVSEAKPINRY